MALTLETIRDIMRNADPNNSKAGADCRWLSLGVNYKRLPVGVKMFSTPKLFSHCRYWHDWASKNRVGPKVFGSFKAEFGGMNWLCIAMEEVEMCFGDLYFDEFRPIRNHITRKMERLGVKEVRDMHKNNVGRRKTARQEIVAIDFSRFNWRDNWEANDNDWLLWDIREEYRDFSTT